METKLLQEKSRSTKVIADVERGGIIYSLEYDFADKEVNNLDATISKADDGTNIGAIKFKDKSINISVYEKYTSTAEEHLDALKDILAEIRKEILAEAKAKEEIK